MQWNVIQLLDLPSWRALRWPCKIETCRPDKCTVLLYINVVLLTDVLYLLYKTSNIMLRALGLQAGDVKIKYSQLNSSEQLNVFSTDSTYNRRWFWRSLGALCYQTMDDFWIKIKERERSFWRSLVKNIPTSLRRKKPEASYNLPQVERPFFFFLSL